MDLHIISLLVFALISLGCIVSIHRKFIVKDFSGPIWPELIIGVVCTIAHLLIARASIGSGRLAATDMINFMTVVYGIVGPVLMMFLPGTMRIMSLWSVCMSIPFTAMGALLHLFNIIESPLCVYYFVIPAIIGFVAMFTVNKWSYVKDEKEVG